jgi:macrodomain Ter protein organizer (MatP/YcbG family)
MIQAEKKQSFKISARLPLHLINKIERKADKENKTISKTIRELLEQSK